MIELTSADIFPPEYANTYMALDAEVRRNLSVTSTPRCEY